MPLRSVTRAKTSSGKVNVVVKQTSGETRAGMVQRKSNQAPAGLTVVTSTTGGTLAAATYNYRVSAVVGGVESLACTGVTVVTTGATSSNILTWAGVPAATSYKVYGRSGADGALLLMATVTAPTKTFTDDATLTPSGALPAGPTATNCDIYVDGSHQTNVQVASALRQANRYYRRY